MKSALHLAFVSSILATQIFVTQGTRVLYFDQGKYQLRWDVTSNSIQFYISVGTTGWVGLGFSTTGTMENSDLFIGGITDADSIAYHGDYYGTENEAPTADAQDDWTVVVSLQSATSTILTVSRLLVTSDESGQDLEIPDAQIHLLWAYGETDEVSYHLAKRGSILINLIDETDVATTTDTATTTTEAATTTTEAATTTTEAATTTTETATTTTEAATTTTEATTTTTETATTTTEAATTTTEAATTTTEAATTTTVASTTTEAGGGSKILGSFSSVLFFAVSHKILT